MSTNYHPSEYIEFLFDIDHVDVPRKEKRAFEDRVDRLLESSGYDDEVSDYDEVYYLTLASLRGSGTGLWEGREEWHEGFEKEVQKSRALQNAFTNLEMAMP